MLTAVARFFTKTTLDNGQLYKWHHKILPGLNNPLHETATIMPMLGDKQVYYQLFFIQKNYISPQFDFY
jgi:hypothetical protein